MKNIKNIFENSRKFDELKINKKGFSPQNCMEPVEPNSYFRAAKYIKNIYIIR